MKNETTTVLWGVKKGNEDWQEQILTTNPARIEEVKALATRDGFDRFRIATIDLNARPNFGALLANEKK